MPNVADSVASASATSFLSPRAHGAIAPSASDFDGSGTMRAGSKSQVAPRPWHSGHAPCGELNENARGDSSGTLMPQLTHAIRRENSRSPSSRPLMTTISLASWSAVSIDSVRRRSMPERTTSRSTTTSIVWFFRRSSLMSSSSERKRPSMRAFEKPRVRSASSSFLNSPLRPRTIGASTLMRSSCGYVITRSMMRSSDWLAISRPQFGQCGTPIFAKSSRR